MAKKSILWYVFVGSRGSETRINIVESVLGAPKNPRELAKALGKDYSTITHSLRVLERNRIVFTPEKKYGAKYRITPEFEGMMDEYADLMVKRSSFSLRAPSSHAA